MVNRILLIDVELDKKATASQLEKNWTHYPTGLLYLAASIHHSFPKIEIKIFHTSVYEDSMYELTKVVSSYKPDLIGLRSLSRFKKRFNEFASLCKRFSANSILIAGGPYPSISYEEVLKNTSIDLVIIGEGEKTIVEVVEALNSDFCVPQNIIGSVVKINNEIKVNPPREYIKDLNEISFPNYDLINIEEYQGFSNHAFGKTEKCAYILGSRGCPYNCFYCHQLFGKKLRRRSPNNIVEEMREKYQKYGIKEFVFLDDIFNVPLNECKKTLKLIKKELPRDISIDFPNGMRADCIDDELIFLLRECGMKNIALAVESASPKIQKFIGKNLNLDKAFYNIEKISKEFITTVFYMIGFPYETFDDAKMTIEFAQKLKYVSQPVLSILRVYQNTRIYNFLQPNDTQKKYIMNQECLDLQTKLNEQMHFYGDVFSDELVPLNSKSINCLRLRWLKKVLLDPVRLSNSNRILEKFLSEDEIVLFYKDIFDENQFDIQALRRR